MEYIYDAIGTKLLKRSTIAGTTTERYYAGLFEYDGTEGLKLIHTDEGIVEAASGTYDYQYFLKDHLGNTRVTFSIDTALQLVDYYPFGMISFKDDNSVNDYLYNGKELQDELGMEWYDYGARFYDPQIGRFFSLDPNTEDYSSWSPYLYAANNPIRYTDKYGEGPEDRVKVTFSKDIDPTRVSKQSIMVIKSIAYQAGINEITITSTYRSEQSQIETMYDRIKNSSPAKQRITYNSKGDKVIDAYEEASNKEGATPKSVQEAMLDKAKEIGFISKHSSLGYDYYNAIDISYRNLSPDEYKKLREAAEGCIYISFVRGKEENDAALHIEIPTITTEDEKWVKQGELFLRQYQEGKISPSEYFYKMWELCYGE